MAAPFALPSFLHHLLYIGKLSSPPTPTRPRSSTPIIQSTHPIICALPSPLLKPLLLTKKKQTSHLPQRKRTSNSPERTREVYTREDSLFLLFFFYLRYILDIPAITHPRIFGGVIARRGRRHEASPRFQRAGVRPRTRLLPRGGRRAALRHERRLREDLPLHRPPRGPHLPCPPLPCLPHAGGGDTCAGWERGRPDRWGDPRLRQDRYLRCENHPQRKTSYPALRQGRLHPRPPRVASPPPEGRGAESGHPPGGLVPRHGRGVLLHGDGQRQPGLGRSLYRAVRVHPVPQPLDSGPTRVRPPRAGTVVRGGDPPHSRGGRDALPPPLLHHGVLPARHRRRPPQPALPGDLPRGAVAARRVAGQRRGLPCGPPFLLGGAQRVELQGGVPTRAPRRVEADAGPREDEPRGGPDSAVAAAAVRAEPLRAVRTLLPVRARWVGPRGGRSGHRAVRSRAQHGEGGGVRGGRHGGRERRTPAGGDTALEEAVVR